MKGKALFLILLAACSLQPAWAQSGEALFEKVRAKVLQVKDYEADVAMKVDVAFMKVPLLKGKLFFRAPDKMKLERKGGISILPKKTISLSLSNLIPTGQVTVIDMGMTSLKNKMLRLLKVVPDDDTKGIVLTKLWLDEKDLLIFHTETTTFNEGSVIMDLEYKNHISLGLPDKVKIFMDLKEYKLPKGVTMDYGDVPDPSVPAKGTKKQKGSIEIRYLNYRINQGIPEEFFKTAGKS